MCLETHAPNPWATAAMFLHVAPTQQELFDILPMVFSYFDIPLIGIQ